MLPKETETAARSPGVSHEAELHKALAADYSVSLDPMALEAVTLNLEASLRVHTDPHFFSWTQGLLQNLIRHEVLICALRKGEAELSPVESYSTVHTEPKIFGQMYRHEAALVEGLIGAWESGHFQPVIHQLDSDALFANSALSRELIRVGANKIVGHGTHDSDGRMVSFFVFACRAGDIDGKAARSVEMLLPFLHAAWVRSKCGRSAKTGEGSAHASSLDLLTLREQEVLKWVCLGKSNIEIGLILGISPLTVKNHVQEILRRLNVQNRAQAVGKAFNLHILTC